MQTRVTQRTRKEKKEKRHLELHLKVSHAGTIAKKSKYISLHMRGQWQEVSSTQLVPPPKKVIFLILLPSNRENLIAPLTLLALSAPCILASLLPNYLLIAPPPPPTHNHRLLYRTQKQPCRSSSPLLFGDGSTSMGSQASSRSRKHHLTPTPTKWPPRSTWTQSPMPQSGRS